MNANDIWSGNEYAHVMNKPKGVDAPAGAAKVRAIRVIKRLEYGKTRETAYVISEILDPGSNWRLEVGSQVELRARDYVDFWDDYSHRREEIEKENRERAERVERARQERLRAEEERVEAAERKKKELLQAFSDKTGIPIGWLIIEFNIIGVRNTHEFRRWILGYSHDV